ncbi:amino acid dehydrogenase, partial [Polaribacter sp.]|nr:amino acid dehydrogenase [Polaribacter sp.]
YGTGGDLNVDADKDVIPITEDCGVWHPQEGIFNGHFKPSDADKINRIGQLRLGVIKVIEDTRFSPDLARKYTIADMLTGYGVAEAVKHYYTIYGGNIEGKRAIVQGFGNVGSAAAYYLTKLGAKVVGIIDREGGVIREEGFSIEEMTALFLSKNGNQLVSENMISFDEINDQIWSLPAEIFVPAAASRLVSKEQVQKMIDTGLEVISPGANVPFADKEIFFGPIMEHTDKHISLLPDFISNCGIARVFAYFMESRIELPMQDKAIFDDTSNIIKKALQRTFNKSASKTKICSTAFEIALKELI